MILYTKASKGVAEYKINIQSLKKTFSYIKDHLEKTSLMIITKMIIC